MIMIDNIHNFVKELNNNFEKICINEYIHDFKQLLEIDDKLKKNSEFIEFVDSIYTKPVKRELFFEGTKDAYEIYVKT